MARRIQLPNFTPFPDEIIDRHLPDLSGPELKILIYILRKTVRYGKREFTITQADLGGPCGLDRSVVCRSCKHLVEMELLIVDKNSTSDGSCAASTYGVAFADEGGCAPATQGVCTSNTGGGDKSPQHKESIDKETIERDLIPHTPLLLSDPITEGSVKWVSQRFRTAGRKITAAEKRMLSEWLGELAEKYVEGDIEASLSWFFKDDYWRQKNFPPSAYRSQFEKYLDLARGDSAPAETNQDAPASTPSVTPTSAPSTPSASGSGYCEAFPRVDLPPRDFLAEWNRKVPSGVTSVDTGTKATEDYRACWFNPKFHEQFNEVCDIAEKILIIDPSKTWLDFYWVLAVKNGSSKRGWERVLGNMRGWSVPMSRPGQAGPGLDDAAKKRILDSMRPKDGEDEDAED